MASLRELFCFSHPLSNFLSCKKRMLTPFTERKNKNWKYYPSRGYSLPKARETLSFGNIKHQIAKNWVKILEQSAFFNTVKTGRKKKEDEEEGKGEGEEEPEIEPVKLWWVSVEVLHSLLAFGSWMLSSGSFPFAASPATWAGARLSRPCRFSPLFFLLVPINSRSFTLSLSFFFFHLFMPSSAMHFSFKGPCWTCS